jgi:membrane-bound lytic murein transglycosylase A
VVPSPPTAGAPTGPAADLIPLAFGRVGFAALPNWSATDVGAARRAFVRTCRLWSARSPAGRLSDAAPYSGRISDWTGVCVQASNPAVPDRAFWESNFTPWMVRTPTGAPGRLTSYFEPVMQVSATRSGTFVEPIQARPADLLTVDLGAFDAAMAGRTLVGRVEGNRLVPYRTRAEVTTATSPVLAWGEMGEVLSLQIQGSGRLVYPDGRQVRAAFAAHNGRPFGSVARELIRRGELSANAASADAITDWFRRADPAVARQVMNANPRTVFFALEEIADPSAGPRGAVGLPLEPNGSLAVDLLYHAYGVPVFLTADGAQLANATDRSFQRLLIAQDTGGAIRGPLRGDLFWGTGSEAGLRAGRVSHEARWWVLLPNGLDPVTAGNG